MFRKCLRAAGLFGLTLGSLQAGYVSASLNSGADGSACGSTGIDVGQLPCPTGSAIPSVVSTDSLFAYADFGVNKASVNGVGSAGTEWMVRYTLTGGTVGTPVNLLVQIDYEVDMAVSGVNQESNFRMVLNYDTFGPFDISLRTYAFFGSECREYTGPCEPGFHRGTWSRNVWAAIGSTNRLALNMGVSTSSGIVDASHTVRILRIIVPDGITWSYEDGLAGNPLNFQYAGDPPTSEVPEPGTYLLSAVGLAGIGVLRRRQPR